MDTEVLVWLVALVFLSKKVQPTTICYPTNDENLKEQTKIAVLNKKAVSVLFFCKHGKGKTEVLPSGLQILSIIIFAYLLCAKQDEMLMGQFFLLFCVYIQRVPPYFFEI